MLAFGVTVFAVDVLVVVDVVVGLGEGAAWAGAAAVAVPATTSAVSSAGQRETVMNHNFRWPTVRGHRGVGSGVEMQLWRSAVSASGPPALLRVGPVRLIGFLLVDPNGCGVQQVNITGNADRATNRCSCPRALESINAPYPLPAP